MKYNIRSDIQFTANICLSIHVRYQEVLILCETIFSSSLVQNILLHLQCEFMCVFFSCTKGGIYKQAVKDRGRRMRRWAESVFAHGNICLTGDVRHTTISPPSTSGQGV